MTIRIQAIATRAQVESPSRDFSFDTNIGSSMRVISLFDSADIWGNNNLRTNRGEIRTFLRDVYDSNGSGALGGGELRRLKNDFPGLLAELGYRNY